MEGRRLWARTWADVVNMQGDNDTIQSFCLTNYGVSFPILGKTDVNGEKAEPVYEWMKASIPGLLGMKRIKWNFEKFMIGKDGVCLFILCIIWVGLGQEFADKSESCS